MCVTLLPERTHASLLLAPFSSYDLFQTDTDTVKILKIRTTKIFAVIILKFEQDGFTVQ